MRVFQNATQSGRYPRGHLSVQRQNSWIAVLDWQDIAAFIQENIETLMSVSVCVLEPDRYIVPPILTADNRYIGIGRYVG